MAESDYHKIGSEILANFETAMQSPDCRPTGQGKHLSIQSLALIE